MAGPAAFTQMIVAGRDVTGVTEPGSWGQGWGRAQQARSVTLALAAAGALG